MKQKEVKTFFVPIYENVDWILLNPKKTFYNKICIKRHQKIYHKMKIRCTKSLLYISDKLFTSDEF